MRPINQQKENDIMSSNSSYITFGTAGHIDHGKSSLVRKLTGVEVDTLKEEIKREMTIELGHAPWKIDDHDVCFIDVPGHEAFIRTMVAGATGMDAVIFVIAADDGIMPQTIEHLDILTLLGIQYGFIALTKIDRVEPHVLQEVQSDIRHFLKNTFLADAPIIPINNLTGEGFNQLENEIRSIIQKIPTRKSEGIFRMPIEKAFSIPGVGSIFTGTPTCGTIRQNDSVFLSPNRKKRGRIRGIQCFGQSYTVAPPGKCLALNVPDFSPNEVKRGDVFSTLAIYSANWFLAELGLLPDSEIKIPNGCQVKLHTGTSETNAIIYLQNSEDVISGNTKAYVQIRTTDPLAIIRGDRFIIRNATGTIGGGLFLQSNKGRLRRYEIDFDFLDECKYSLTSPEAWLIHCMNYHSSPVYDLDKVMKVTHFSDDEAQKYCQILMDKQLLVGSLGSNFMLKDQYDKLAQTMLDALTTYHELYPSRTGPDRTYLREQTQMASKTYQFVFDRLTVTYKIKAIGALISKFNFTPVITQHDAYAIECVEKVYKDARYAPPSELSLRELLPNVYPSNIYRALEFLSQQGTLVYVAPHLYFHRDMIELAKEKFRKHIQTNETGKLFSVDAKYLLENTTRKYALPLLDFLDQQGFFIREGNTRILRNP